LFEDGAGIMPGGDQNLSGIGGKIFIDLKSHQATLGPRGTMRSRVNSAA
jgi:hypothetical protein